MLQDIRDKSQGWIAYVIVGLIAITFVIIGTGSFFSSNEGTIVAKVNGQEISQREVDSTYERYLLSLSDRTQAPDPSAYKSLALENLINEKAMLAGIEKRGFRVSEQFIIQAIQQDPSFQVDGRFSPERYSNLLSQNYYTDLQYRQHLSNRYVMAQLQQGLILTNFSLEDDLETLFKFMDQKRDFEYATIESDDFKSKVNISAEDVKEYYESNISNFYTPEQVKIDYLELSVEDLKSTIQYNEDSLKQFYLENIQLFTDPEKFKVAHILVAIDSKDPQGEQKALEKTREIKARVSKGEDFAKLAETLSDDPSTAKKGGELHWINKGIMAVSMEFDEAVYKLTKDKPLSEPVLTSYGYHLIKLVDHKDAHVQSFNDAKKQVIDLYKTQKAEIAIIDKADELVSLSYEHSDNLDTAADALDLEVQTTDFFTRNKSADGIASYENVIRAAFSPEVLEDKLNSELIEIAKNHYIVLRVRDHQAPQLKSYESVEAEIKQKLVNKKARELAEEHAKAVLAKIKDSSLDELKQQDSLKWKQASNMSRMDSSIDVTIVDKVFAMPNEGKPVADYTATLGNDFAIIVLKKVKDGSISDVDEQRLEAMKSGLSQNMGALDLQLFTKEVKDSVKVKKMAEES